MEQFETSYIITADTYKEMKWKTIPPRDIIICSGGVIGAVMLIVGSIMEQSPVMIFVGIVVAFVFIFTFFLAPKRNIKINLQRAKETTGTTDLEVQTAFADDGIKLHDLSSGGRSTVDYGNVNRFAETKNMYILLTKANLLIIVNKATLAQAGETEAFLQFIKSKLPHVKIKRP
ncbi:MAG: YcxB family protein [Defluviitaleaceae bacterium]|nr:YcxB family protein [Defluviitaleaceae bacterium]